MCDVRALEESVKEAGWVSGRDQANTQQSLLKDKIIIYNNVKYGNPIFPKYLLVNITAHLYSIYKSFKVQHMQVRNYKNLGLKIQV